MLQHLIQPLGQCLRILLDKMHDPQTPRLMTIETRGGQRQSACLSQSNALHHKRRDLRRQQAEAGFRQTELGLVISHRHVADTGQSKPTAHHRALQHADQHLRRVLGFLQQRAERPVQISVSLGTLGAGIGHVLDVAAGTEMSAATAEHQRANSTVIANGRQHRAQFADHLQAHRIAAVRAIEGDVQHTAMQFQKQRLAFGQATHFFFPGRMPISLQMIPSMISSAPPPIDTSRTSR